MYTYIVYVVGLTQTHVYVIITAILFCILTFVYTCIL